MGTGSLGPSRAKVRWNNYGCGRSAIHPQPPAGAEAADAGSCHRARMSEDEGVQISGYPLTGIIRQIRRRADFSQRELAKFAQLSRSTVGAIETGAITPSLSVLQRLLNAANCQLVVVDADGRLVVPLLVWRDTADGAGRRYPAHLDTILDPVM